jgi:ABC-type phosphate transport system substrate-binding protein
MNPRAFLPLLFVAILAAAPAARAADVVAVVSARSTVKALTPAEVADIFLGKEKRYPDGTPAVPIDQTEDSPVRERFYAQFAGKSPAQVKAHWSKLIFTGRGLPPRQVSGGAEAIKAVADDPRAIAYVAPSLVDSSVRVLAAR